MLPLHAPSRLCVYNTIVPCTGKGDGVHVLTGPIYMCGAEPGDVLQVLFLSLLLTHTWEPAGVLAVFGWGNL